MPVTRPRALSSGDARMPNMPATFKGNRQTKQERGRLADRRRDERREDRGWYDLAIWRKRIRPQQLAREPLCQRCLPRGLIVAASVVNHMGGHGGEWTRFINGPFESLCAPCHDGEVQREESAAR